VGWLLALCGWPSRARAGQGSGRGRPAGEGSGEESRVFSSPAELAPLAFQCKPARAGRGPALPPRLPCAFPVVTLQEQTGDLGSRCCATRRLLLANGSYTGGKALPETPLSAGGAGPSSGGYSPSELGALLTSVRDPGISERGSRRLQDPSASLWAGVT